MSRGGFRPRGRWNDSWDYRRQDRFDRRGGGRGTGPRFGKYGRSTSRSPEERKERKDRWTDDSMKDNRKDDDRRSREGSKKDDVKW